jgi:DNA sulfur modification protein DndB
VGALTTFTVLYDVLHYLGFDLPVIMREKKLGPSDDILDESYNTLTARFNDLLASCGNIRERLEGTTSAREVRAPKNAEGDGHPFMRPAIQKAVARVASEIMLQGVVPWPEIMQRLGALDWKMSFPPWEAVFSTDAGKMLVGKENTDLLCELLHVHLAPTSVQAIKRARKNFKDIRGKQYPIPEEELAKRVPQEEVPPPTPIVLPEVSAEPETEAAAPPSGDGAPAEATPPVVADASLPQAAGE